MSRHHRRAVELGGRIARRAYLGEHLDYGVRPTGSARALRVTARPHEVFEVDEEVWLTVEPGHTSTSW